MYRFHRERWQAYGDVFRPAFGGGGILDPFAAVGNDSLAGGDIQFAGLMLYPQGAFQHDCEFVELRSPSRLFPTLGTAHMGDAHTGGLGVDPPDEFVNQFWLAARSANARGLSDQSGHRFSSMK